ncbi:MAG: CopG family transcriptional regulator [Terriglobia bacterium]
MVRTQIFLTAEQRRHLRAWSRLEKKTASALIRTAIEERYVHRPTPADFRAALDEAFGSWKGRKKSSIAMVRAWRRGKRLKSLSG